MANAITTEVAKKKMLLARAGAHLLPKITNMAFGTGGVDAEGSVLEVGEKQQALNVDVLRKEIDE